MDLSIFETILVLLIVSIFTSSLFQRLNIPVIVGYLAVGIALGQHSFGLIANNHDVTELAEFGMVFLMFNIGLEFSFDQIMRMKKSVFLYGGLQVLLAIGATVLIGPFLTLTIPQCLVLGSILAMSSTAIVVKQLSQQRQVHTHHGEHSIGILLFQDLAVIPVLILVPSLANTDSSVAKDLMSAIVLAAFSIGFIFLVGRKVLRPLFFVIANMKNLEVFTLTTLLVALGAAWLTYWLGLSLTLGAFIAGMMLGETEFRHQIENDIRPFRDVLMGFFFITIGSQFNLQATMNFWPWVLVLFLGLVIFKTVLIGFLGRCLKIPFKTSVQSGLILAHGGEFGFAILTLALSHHLFPNDYGQVTMAALLLSMLIAPLMIRYSGAITNYLLLEDNLDQQILSKTPTELENHIVIGGYGRVGQLLAKHLKACQIPYIAFDLDPKIVQAAHRQGEPVFYADLTHHNLLDKAKLEEASALVLSFNDTKANQKIIQQIRSTNYDICIYARAHDETEAQKLEDYGASEVIPEIYEASLSLSARIMQFMGVEDSKIQLMLREQSWKES